MPDEYRINPGQNTDENRTNIGYWYSNFQSTAVISSNDIFFKISNAFTNISSNDIERSFKYNFQYSTAIRGICENNTKISRCHVALKNYCGYFTCCGTEIF